LSFIDIAHSKYIRIAYDEMPDALFAWDHSWLYTQHDIPMTAFGYAGIWWTILIQPSLLVPITQALQYIQTTHGIGFDLFVHTWPRDVYSQQLTDSLHHTGKLIVIHDQWDHTALRDSEQKVFKASGLQWDVQVFFKNPDYSKITTILPEYMYEQVWYSPDTLTHYLISLK
jgi:hypothetical protein